MIRSALRLALVPLAAACAHGGRVESPRVADAGAVVRVWVTAGDRAKLLTEEPSVRFGEPPVGVATVVVDEARRFQEIVGFGAALSDASAWLIQHRLTSARRERLLQELFGRADDGLGLSFTRVDMGGSDFAQAHYSYDDVPPGHTDPTLAAFSIAPDLDATVPILKRALAINPRLKVMATPWSAPAWMKSSGHLVKGTLKPEAYDPFARYFRKFIEAYAAEGVPVWGISVQNEPHFEPDDYPGMRLEPAERARFVGRHLGPLLEASHPGVQILDWDHNWDQPESPLAVLADPTARRYVDGVAWHCYGGDVGAQSRVHDAHPDKDAYFTECSGGRWSPGFAGNVTWMARTLVVGATRNWARGVLLWNLALDEAHGPHLGGCGDCRGVVTIHSTTGEVERNEEWYALGHASRFVRPGARRIASTTGVEGIETVAFRNADDGSKVVIAVNTNGAEQAFAVRAGDRAFRFALPAGGVATFRWP